MIHYGYCHSCYISDNQEKNSEDKLARVNEFVDNHDLSITNNNESEVSISER